MARIEEGKNEKKEKGSRKREREMKERGSINEKEEERAWVKALMEFACAWSKQ